MGEQDSKLQTVNWREGSNIEPAAAYSSITTEKEALDLARTINKVNPMTAFVRKADDGYRIEIPKDDALENFRKKFPSVKVDRPRQALQRIRDGYKDKDSQTSINER
jgi:putative ubiquitin-RnfH superfamily antitoxin RatB of RatAB toxin-antitoxin module